MKQINGVDTLVPGELYEVSTGNRTRIVMCLELITEHLKYHNTSYDQYFYKALVANSQSETPEIISLSQYDLIKMNIKHINSKEE